MPRNDGMPDLNNWQPYLKECGCKTIGEMSALLATKGDGIEGIWLDKAISARTNEIADAIVKNLCNEGLSIMSAIKVLSLVRGKIMKTKFIP